MSQNSQSELMSHPEPLMGGPTGNRPMRSSDKVANRLRYDILGGRLPVGSRLLPERKLAEVLGVSRVTVRSAIATLQSEQLLDVRRGSGITVMDYRRSSSIDLFQWLMASNELPIEEQFRIFKQVVHVRQALAVPTLFEAVALAGPADKALIRELIEEQRNNVSDGMKYLMTDLEVGQSIARIANNVVVELLHNSLKRCMSIRWELVLAFLGPLDDHFQHYQFLLGAFEQGAALTNNPVLQQQTAEIIRGFENTGLERARRWLEQNNAQVETEAPEGPALSQELRG